MPKDSKKNAKNAYGRHVFVTGASGGIGRACALAFAEEGCTVIGVARHCEENTTRFPGGGSLTTMRMDVTSESDVRRVVGALETVDIAVLAAGMGVSGPAEELPEELARKQMEVNYFGVLHVGSAILPLMRRQGKGLFLVIGSIAGRVPIPMQSHYSASKYALEAYVQSVRMEMHPFGVRACILEPGDTRTGFTAAREKYCPPDSPYAEICERSVGKMEEDEQNGRPPESVAKVALRLAGRKRPPARVPIGAEYRALMLLLRLVPDQITERVLKSLYL